MPTRRARTASDQKRRDFIIRIGGGAAALSVTMLVLALTGSGGVARPASNKRSAEALRLEFERDKWRAESDMRERELALKEREQATKDVELQLKREEQASSKWWNPLVVAIFAAALAAVGNAIVAVINGRLQRQLETSKGNAERVLEESKAESTRILEMIKTGDTETAAKNLAFLLNAGLVVEKGRANYLREYLANRQPGTGPSLPSPSGRFSLEPTAELTPSVQGELQKMLEKYIAYLDTIGFPSDLPEVKIKIDKLDSPNAFYFENSIVIDSRISGDAFAALREYSNHVMMSKSVEPWEGDFAAIQSGLADYFPASFLNTPNVGELVAKVLKTGKPYIRCLDNKRRFRRDPQAAPHHMGEIWGGAFWEMRVQLNRDVIDPILVKAWLNLLERRHDEKTAEVVEAFLNQLLIVAEMKSNKNCVAAMRIILQRRRFQ